MLNSSFSTLSEGTMALVVQEAAPKIESSSIISLLIPWTIFLIPSLAGAVSKTLDIPLQFK